MKPRLVFISNIAAPYQVKFCYALQSHFDAEFWFYERLTEKRPVWWKVPLGNQCHVLEDSRFIKRLNYLSFSVFKKLVRFKPDVILLGGFTPLHWLILKVAKQMGSKVVILSEPIRNVANEYSRSDKLLQRADAPRKTNRIHSMFQEADLIFGMGQVACEQFVREFGFNKDKVLNAPYPIDIEAYFDHPLRIKQPKEPLRILFANRLIERYQPLLALEAYKNLKSDYPQLSIALNREGHLYEACCAYIEQHDLKDVHFLEEIKAWDDMHLVYRESDILVLPATYSNGNLTIVEACASGMGVIVSHSVDNVSRHLTENVNCFKCVADAISLETSLRRYLQSPELLQKHGAISKQQVEHRRNDVTATTYRDYIQPILSSNNKGAGHHDEAHAAWRGDASSPHFIESEGKRDLHDSV